MASYITFNPHWLMFGSTKQLMPLTNWVSYARSPCTRAYC